MPLKIKCHYKDVRVVLVDMSVTYADLVAAIAAKYECRPTFRLKYQDEERDHVLLTDAEDLALALATVDPAGGAKLELWCA